MGYWQSEIHNRFLELYCSQSNQSMWRPSHVMELWHSSGPHELFSIHIHVWLSVGGDSQPVWLIGFYGHSKMHHWHKSWQLLECLNVGNMKSWCVIGDFNEITAQHEKDGGRNQPALQMDLLWKAIESNGFADLGWTGQKFTWSNRHTSETYIKERLDQVLANRSWLTSSQQLKFSHPTNPTAF